MFIRCAAVVAALSLVALAVACAPASGRSAGAETAITVFAAASLAESFQALGSTYKSQNPDVDIVFNFAGSQTLSTQLGHGADADVFASANWEHMAGLQEAGLLGNVPEYFAANRMAVVTPAGSDAVLTLADLARPGVTIAIASSQVPAGAYARDSLALMSEDDAFPHDFAAAVMSNVVTNETNVRGVAQKVALGEVDAGFVYETDAEAAQYAGSFGVLEIPLRFNPAAQYPIAPLSGSARLPDAMHFIRFIQGDSGQAILREFGFVPPANVACPCHAGSSS